MKISFEKSSKPPKGTWVVGATEGSLLLPAAMAADDQCAGGLARALKTAGFSGKAGEFVELLAPVGIASSRILLVGLGKPDAIDEKTLETTGAQVVGRIKGPGELAATFQIDVPVGTKIEPAVFAAHLAFGARLGSYSFTKYYTRGLDELESKLQQLVIATQDAAAAKLRYLKLSSIADGVFFARDLVNEPPNVLYPAEFARRAKSVLSKLGVKVDVLGEAEMKKLGFGALLGVGQGSDRESQLVVMQWRGGAASKAPIALVGKGVCYDSGGISIKIGASLRGMKADMAGAAAVTGTLLALATRKAKVNVVGIIGLVENMPSGHALRPDDILTSLSGQTIEVLNTDAEGRLVLADVLTYTQQRFKPSAVVDLATLTGTIRATLGAEYAGVFSNSDNLVHELQIAGRCTGERVWQLPLDPFYDKMLKSKIADMKNIGSGNSASIVAAQFLHRFIENGMSWAHLDIAGVAYQTDEQRPTIPSWGTGWGVGLLNKFISMNYEAN